MWNVPRSDQYNVSAIKNIQCMIIGDVLVGKTSFLTTVATEAFPDNCPYPTVIDNHVLHVRLRNGKEVALTFWDFSGYEEYEKIRGSGYAEADVLLVCFSVGSTITFENIKDKWIPEIKRYCPHVPWLLVGMQCDLRTDVHQIQYRIDHGTWLVEEMDGVKLAKDLGAVGYYECSAKEGIGLDSIMVAAHAAAIGVKSKAPSIWPWKRHNSSKRKSLMPPSPELFTLKPPEIDVPISALQPEWLKMVNNEYLSDVQFHYKSDRYFGHKVVLCAASSVFRRIFEIGGEVESGGSSSYCNTWSKKRINAINRRCINSGAVKAFKNVYDKNNLTVITVNDEQVSKSAFEWCLSFLYGGCADVKNDSHLDDIIAAAELLNLPKLIRICDNVKNDNDLLNPYLTRTFATQNSKNMEELFFNETRYSDITFVVDGQKIPAHRCVLTTRCEVMSAMFSGQFAESKATEVELPGVDLDGFMAFLQYLYADECSLEEEVTTILVLADQYGVYRLKTLCELHISEIVKNTSEASIANGELDVIDLLHNAQLHNADQLSGFLLRFVANNFKVFRKTEQFRKLTGQNLSYVKEHRKPSSSYVNAVKDQEKKEEI